MSVNDVPVLPDEKVTHHSSIELEQMVADHRKLDPVDLENETYHARKLFCMDWQESISRLKLISKLGSRNAMYEAASALLTDARNLDQKEGMRMLRYAANELDHTGAQFDLALILEKEKSGDHIEMLKRAANNNHPTAQLRLGCSYFHGIGVQPCFSEAAKWLRLCSRHTNSSQLLYARALDELGQHEESLGALLEAATRQSPKAELKLFFKRFWGIGCERDMDYACTWLVRCSKGKTNNEPCAALAKHIIEICQPALSESSPVPRLLTEKQLQDQLNLFA